MSKVLIIEDDNSLNMGLRDLLEANGYSVTTADNGEEGLSLIKRTKPDLIICDILMPTVDGYEVKKELGKKKETSQIPFIFLTAKADLKDLRIGMQLGADDYIVKPFDSIDLLNSIKLRLKKNMISKNASNPGSSENAADIEKKLTENDYIFITSEGVPKLILVGDIRCITGSGNNSIVIINGSLKFSIRRTLAKWEKLLPGNTFKRIHKSTIINMKFVKNISKWSSGAYLVHMKELDETFVISQRYAKLMRSSLK